MTHDNDQDEKPPFTPFADGAALALTKRLEGPDLLAHLEDQLRLNRLKETTERR